MEDLPEITERMLAVRNGLDRPETWIAYKGIVYNVTGSRFWRQGKHYEHWAGQDLTPEMIDAPHFEEVFDELEVVGRLV